MKKEQQTSILDLILDQMPGLQFTMNKTDKMIDESLASNLYSIWRNEKNKVSSKVYKRPDSVSSAVIDDLAKEGFVRAIGDKLEITSRGSDIIKTMILGNNKSAFDGGDKDISYRIASLNIKSKEESIKAKKKKTNDDWWSRF